MHAAPLPPPSDTNETRDVVTLGGGQGAGLLLLQGLRDMYLDAPRQSSAMLLFAFAEPFSRLLALPVFD